MKIAKGQEFAIMRDGLCNEGTYQIYSDLESLHEAGVDPLMSLCAEWFEALTGITMEDQECAVVTLRVTKAQLEETKLIKVPIR